MRRIRRDLIHEKFIQELTSGEPPLFKDLWRILLFAAILGHRAGKRVPVSEYDSGKAMPDAYFTNSPAWPGVLYLLGLVETNSTNALSSKQEDEDALIQVFEEYANGGLHLLRERLEGRDALKTILDLVDEFSDRSMPSVPDLASVAI
jgi:dnd system-associated protein 4